MRISYNTIKEIIENQIKIYEHPFNIEKIFPASFIAQELKNILANIDRAEQIELENEYKELNNDSK